jgi:hypothetical protein
MRREIFVAVIASVITSVITGIAGWALLGSAKIAETVTAAVGRLSAESVLAHLEFTVVDAPDPSDIRCAKGLVLVTPICEANADIGAFGFVEKVTIDYSTGNARGSCQQKVKFGSVLVSAHALCAKPK